MALKAVPVSQVPYIDQFHENNALYNGEDDVGERRKMATFILKENKFVVMGHRGSGMNILQSCDRRSKAIKENTLCSFNEAAKFNVDFIEFDVQVR